MVMKWVLLPNTMCAFLTFPDTEHTIAMGILVPLHNLRFGLQLTFPKMAKFYNGTSYVFKLEMGIVP